MRIFKLLILNVVMVVFLMTSCAVRKGVKSRDFKLVRAEQKVYYPGVMGSPIVYNTNVYIRLKKDFETRAFTADSFWMNGFSDAILHKLNAVSKGDTLVLSLNYTVSTVQEGYPKEELSGTTSPQNKAPMNYEGKALIRYYHKGKWRYFSIPEIAELNSVYAP